MDITLPELIGTLSKLDENIQKCIEAYGRCCMSMDQPSLSEQLRIVEQERDQLRQRIEDARLAYIELTNNVEFKDDSEDCYVANYKLMSAVFESEPLYALPPTAENKPLFRAGWQDEIINAMEEAFSVARNHGRFADDSLVNDDTQLGVEFAIKKIEFMLSTADKKGE